MTPLMSPGGRNRSGGPEVTDTMKKDQPTISTEEVIVLRFPFQVEQGDRPDEVIIRLSDEANCIPVPQVRIEDDTRVFGEGPDGDALLAAVEEAAGRAAMQAFVRGRIQASFGRRPTRY